MSVGATPRMRQFVVIGHDVLPIRTRSRLDILGAGRWTSCRCAAAGVFLRTGSASASESTPPSPTVYHLTPTAWHRTPTSATSRADPGRDAQDDAIGIMPADALGVELGGWDWKRPRPGARHSR